MFGSSKKDEALAKEEPTEASSLTGKGPKDLEERRCADCLCLLAFFIFWVGMAGMAGFIMVAGDPNKIYHGTDYMGNVWGPILERICFQTNGLMSTKFLRQQYHVGGVSLVCYRGWR